MSDAPKQRDILLTFADLVAIAKVNRKTIYIATTLFACLALLYSLSKPVRYQAEGTFREKSKSNNSPSMKGLTEMFMLNASDNSSDILLTMKSRTFIEKFVQTANLQADIGPMESRWNPKNLLRNIKNNILAEYASLTKTPFPILKETTPPFDVSDISYAGEIPLSFFFIPQSDTHFIILDDDGQTIGEGTFGMPFITDRFSLTVKRNTPYDSTQKKDYVLNIHPLGKLAESLASNIETDFTEKDRKLVKITYFTPNRYHAKEHIDLFMTLYEQHLKDEQQRLAKLQLDYLVLRKTQMTNDLQKVLESHAKELSSDLSSTGFPDTTTAKKFFTDYQGNISKRLLSIEIEIQQFEAAKQLNSPLDSVTLMNKFGNNLPFLSETNQLKQEADSIQLALRQDPSAAQAFQQSFAELVKELSETQQLSQEINVIVEQIHNNILPSGQEKLFKHPQFVASEWHSRLRAAKKAANSSTTDQTWEQTKEYFIDYLSNLSHYFQVYERSLGERLAHQQASINEFQGINLTAAKQLYLTYQEELNIIDNELTEYQHILDNINQQDFEVNSLSTILTDTVSMKMIEKASDTMFSLRDSDNRGTKEQERLKEELHVEKEFLIGHLKQALVLTTIKKEQLEKKILRLQSVTLGLIQERLSIMHQQILQSIDQNLQDLKTEQLVLQQHLADFRDDLAYFPKKWITEQLIKQEVQLHESILEEMTKAVESKTISSNLEKILSKPLDHPLTPLHPKPPHLILLTIIGAIVGAAVGYTYALSCSISTGVKASIENLQASGMHVSGSFPTTYNNTRLSLEAINDQDLNILRRLVVFIKASIPPNLPKRKHGDKKTLILLKDHGPDYAQALAQLVAKKGDKVIVLDLIFDQDDNSKEGLLQYLEGVKSLSTQHRQAFDYIPTGGTCRYANELIASKKFHDMLTSLSEQYDWIIATSNASLESAEAESLLHLFNYASISIRDETLTTIQQHLFSDQGNKALMSFLFINGS